MTGAEARVARETLGLTATQLAVEMNITPSAVTAWEDGSVRVPRHIATDLAWRAAVRERETALEASGLPACSWIEALEQQPVSTNRNERSDRLTLSLSHAKSCEVCAARDAFIAERFPPMPPSPRPGLLAVIVPIAERIQALPRWAQAPATGAVLFIAYSLFKLLFLLPQLARSGWAGLLTVVEGFAASAALGALVGFLYDVYRRWRDAASTPDKKMALEFLDQQMAELRAKGIGGGPLRDAYLRQRREILKGKLTLADLQADAEDSAG